MIEFKHVTKKYLQNVALDDVSFRLEPGKIIGIVGENGSGKSTTLKLMSGLVRPTHGTVLINGESADRFISKHVSYLSELDAFYPFFTVGDAADFAKSQFPDYNEQKANEILQFMNLDRNVKVKNLSKGNRGRLKIALVLAREAPIILMDEPLSGLDPLVRDSIVKGFVSFIDLEKQTLIVTTHEIKEIESLLDQVVFIRKGKVLAIEDVEEIRMNQGLSVVDWMKQQHASIS